jgi:hypothetical protein
MFDLTPERLNRLLSLLDDVLGDPSDEAEQQHPHRRPLSWHPIRRPGTIAPRATSCLSPVLRDRRATRGLDTVER